VSRRKATVGVKSPLPARGKQAAVTGNPSLFSGPVIEGGPLEGPPLSRARWRTLSRRADEVGFPGGPSFRASPRWGALTAGPTELTLETGYLRFFRLPYRHAGAAEGITGPGVLPGPEVPGADRVPPPVAADGRPFPPPPPPQGEGLTALPTAPNLFKRPHGSFLFRGGQLPGPAPVAPFPPPKPRAGPGAERHPTPLPKTGRIFFCLGRFFC
jgi:hypothetical protein